MEKPHKKLLVILDLQDVGYGQLDQLPYYKMRKLKSMTFSELPKITKLLDDTSRIALETKSPH